MWRSTTVIYLHAGGEWDADGVDELPRDVDTFMDTRIWRSTTVIYLHAGGEWDADGVDELRWDVDTFPGG